MLSKNKNGKNSFSSLAAGRALWKDIFRKKDSQRESTVSTLRKTALFDSMSQSALREFERIVHLRRFKEQETIFAQGEPGVGMYIIQKGRVGIFLSTTERGKEEMVQLGKGDFFGELVLLDEAPRSARAVALEPTRLLAILRPDVMALMERKPRIGNKFLLKLGSIIGARLSRTTEEMQALLLSKAEKSQIIT